MGAPYFTARNTIFQEQVKEWIDKGVVKVWSNFKAVKIEEKNITDSLDNEIRYVGTPSMQYLV